MYRGEEIARMEAAYRRAKFTLIGHAIFLFLACFAGVVLRRGFGLPPIFLAGVLIVALLVFGSDIMKFLHCRNELRRLRDE
jgi:hypothetical protein